MNKQYILTLQINGKIFLLKEINYSKNFIIKNKDDDLFFKSLEYS